MALGPGKYDALASAAREAAGIGDAGVIGGVVLIVLGGNKGDGFSVQADVLTSLKLPGLLEHIARQIRADMNKRQG